MMIRNADVECCDPVTQCSRMLVHDKSQNIKCRLIYARKKKLSPSLNHTDRAKLSPSLHHRDRAKRRGGCEYIVEL